MPSWSNEQYQAFLRKQNRAGGKASSAQLKQCVGDALHENRKAETRHPGKRIVRITCFRARQLQDPDNGIYKWHIDAIRRAGLVDDDTAQAIRLEIQPEVKVATVEEEKTVIEIEPL